MMRKTLPIPAFDSEVFAPYWAKLEETQTPVVFHINDPEEFWDKDKAPAWAFERDWFYGDGTYINNEAQYTEITNVLERHPNLKLIFAHFLFFSAQLPRLAEWLDRFPNLHVDLTPGIEMYHNFTENSQATRDFFIKYQDRIIFGTDIGARALLADKEGGVQLDESEIRRHADPQLPGKFWQLPDRSRQRIPIRPTRFFLPGHQSAPRSSRKDLLQEFRKSRWHTTKTIEPQCDHRNVQPDRDNAPIHGSHSNRPHTRRIDRKRSQSIF